MNKQEIEHIYTHDDYTLCGLTADECTEKYYNMKDDMTFPDEDYYKVMRERINEFKKNKFEFGSNCKECIKILKRLRKIKK